MIDGSPQCGEVHPETKQAIMRSDGKRNSKLPFSVMAATILRGWLASEAPQIHTWKARPHQVSIDLAGLHVRMGAPIYALLGMFNE